MNEYKNIKRPPCTRNKCISYPICLNKESIICQEIVDYHKHLIKEYNYGYPRCYDMIKKVLKAMKEYATADLPNTQGMSGRNSSYHYLKTLYK